MISNGVTKGLIWNLCIRMLLIDVVNECYMSHLSHGNVEGCLCLPQSSRNVHTVHVGVEALAEHHAIERSVKLYTDLKKYKFPVPMHISS